MRYRWPAAHLLVLLTLLLAVLPPATPVAAGETIALDPAEVDLTVPLGQAIETSITVRNTSDATVPLAAYEGRSDQVNAQQRSVGSVSMPALPSNQPRIEQGLAAALQAAPAQPQEVLIYLRDHADLSPAYRIASWAKRGKFVYRALTEFANWSQRGLQQQLTARGLTYHSLWIVNAVIVRGTAADIAQIAARSDVAHIRLNHTLTIDQAAQTAAELCSPDDPTNPVCWNVRAIRVDAVWRDFGVRGRGVVVANIDTGVAGDHPALAASYRGRNADGSTDNAYNWYDPQGEYAAPTDTSMHGTHTMGVMVGNATSTGPAVGIAPDARWIAAQGCEGILCNDADLIASAQWMLAPTRPDGSAPRPDLRPMIINNSWASGAHDGWYAPYTAAWRAAGIFPVFAAGNATALFPQMCGSVPSPGDYSDVVGVGAINREGGITGFSLFGPASDGRVKPDFVAPGASILSTVPVEKGGYAVLSGTSMAAPHVAGAVALLWSANPALIGDYDATYALLRDSAVRRDDQRCNDPLGAPNNIYGLGRIDVYAAVAKARVDIPWLSIASANSDLPRYGVQTLRLRFDAGSVPGPGTYTAKVLLYGGDPGTPLQTVKLTMRVPGASNQVTVRGIVRDSQSSAPLRAQVAVSQNGTVGATTWSADSGAFSLIVASGAAYELFASAASYQTLRQPLSATGDITVELRLNQDMPRLSLPVATVAVTLPFGTASGQRIPLENTGTRPLFYQVDLPRDGFRIDRSDAPLGPAYAWVDLPPTATTLPAGVAVLTDSVPIGFAFPFFGHSQSEIVVTSNGIIGFDRPLTYRGLTTNCLPDQSFSFYAIVPLRLAIDTRKGGRIRYGQVSGERFVVSYEDVQLVTGPPGQTYTFQVILASNGRIIYQYKQLSPLPDRASVGIQRSPNDVQQVGCGGSTPLRNQLAIAFQPQPSPVFWLATDVVSGTLQPGERTLLPLRIGWQRPQPNGLALIGRVRLTTNDPFAPYTDIPVQVAVRAAPFELWLPISGR